MNIMVTGGAGYIGSHMVKMLLEAGHHVAVVDNFSTGARDYQHLMELPNAENNLLLYQWNTLNTDYIAGLLRERDIKLVMHFAGLSSVAEGELRPADYVLNNVVGLNSVVTAMMQVGVRRIVFSSSAAVYGTTQGEAPCSVVNTTPNPINVYGQTKLMCEQLLHLYRQSAGIEFVALRYFNAAGADPSGTLCERHRPETHLIPVALRAAVRGEEVPVYGNGMALREYVHVNDICTAHMCAMEYLCDDSEERQRSGVFDVGSFVRASVLGVLSAVERVVGKPVRYRHMPPRCAEPQVLCSSFKRTTQRLNWVPHYDDLDTIVADAYRAMKNGGLL